MLIAIEGIDGVGKGTQSALLVKRLQNVGRRPHLLSFPAYSTFFGSLVAEYLNGAFGTLHSLDARLAALLYALDRWHVFQGLRSAAYDIIVVDRYVPSNVAHHAAKLTAVERDGLIDWIQHLEYTVFGLVVPDLVILLDADPEIALRQVASKPVRSYTSKVHDLHESDSVYIRRVREVFLDLARRNPDFVVVRCDGPAGMRGKSEIAADVWHVVECALGTGSRRNGTRGEE
ncbi:MAG: dTMP kinase [Planctomycetota bacterium]|jgi:dTMP kinase